MSDELMYLYELIESDIDRLKETISDAHYAFYCYKENGSGHNEETMNRRINFAKEKIKEATDLKIKLSEKI